jgi:glutamyl-Q tRNA(Asp) synthetase
VRIDDIDKLRERPGSARQILATLEALGMDWDGEVVYQSHHRRLYQQALEALGRADLIYGCNCSRKQIAAQAKSGVEGFIYPGSCRRRKVLHLATHSLRLRTTDDAISFEDRIRGSLSQHIESEIGDFIVRRGDGVFAYQLAVVVDDHQQGITDIVRGEDLLLSTPRQIYLQQLLQLPHPRYAHVPLVRNADGSKLSKSSHAWPVEMKNPVKTLNAAMQFLGLPHIEADSVTEFWPQAVSAWDVAAIHAVDSAPLQEANGAA